MATGLSPLRTVPAATRGAAVLLGWGSPAERSACGTLSATNSCGSMSGADDPEPVWRTGQQWTRASGARRPCGAARPAPVDDRAGRQHRQARALRVAVLPRPGWDEAGLSGEVGLRDHLPHVEPDQQLTRRVVAGPELRDSVL